MFKSGLSAQHRMTCTHTRTYCGKAYEDNVTVFKKLLPSGIILKREITDKRKVTTLFNERVGISTADSPDESTLNLLSGMVVSPAGFVLEADEFKDV